MNPASSRSSAIQTPRSPGTRPGLSKPSTNRKLRTHSAMMPNAITSAMHPTFRRHPPKNARIVGSLLMSGRNLFRHPLARPEKLLALWSLHGSGEILQFGNAFRSGPGDRTVRGRSDSSGWTEPRIDQRHSSPGAETPESGQGSGPLEHGDSHRGRRRWPRTRRLAGRCPIGRPQQARTRLQVATGRVAQLVFSKGGATAAITRQSQLRIPFPPLVLTVPITSWYCSCVTL